MNEGDLWGWVSFRDDLDSVSPKKEDFYDQSYLLMCENIHYFSLQ